MKRSTTARAGMAVALLAAALIPALANATTAVPAQTLTEWVKYGDLNLNQRDDARTLIHRIRVAAHHVCAINSDLDQRQACYEQAVTLALNDVNSKRRESGTSIGGTPRL
jgi:UrcA family protein